MNANACLSFCQSLGIADAKIVERGSEIWVNGTCPMKWKHERGDSIPSFGVRVLDNAESYYYCFAHGAGSLQQLVHSLTWYHDYHFKDACLILTECENLDDPVNSNIEFKDPFVKTPQVTEIPIDLWYKFTPLLQADKYTKAEVTDYLAHRKAKLKDAVFYGVRVWRDYLLFPLTTNSGKLVAIQARKMWTKDLFFMTPKLCGVSGTIFPRLREVGAFFGGGTIPLSTEHPVIVVESPVEALTVRNFGYPYVVACCGSVINSQIDALQYQNIWLGFDADEAGYSSRDRFISRKENACFLSILDWKIAGDEISDPGDLKSRENLIKVTSSRRIVFYSCHG